MQTPTTPHRPTTPATLPFAPAQQRVDRHTPPRTPRRLLRFDSPLGGMLLAASERGLCGVWFEGQRHAPDTAGWLADPAHPVLQRTQDQLQEYMAGQRREFDLPLDMAAGTVFQQAVWQALCAIPFGATTTYGAIGRHIGKPRAVRAVGAAVGRNPLGIIVPCHRVMGSDGSLTGYAGGLDRKAALLQRESTPA